MKKSKNEVITSLGFSSTSKYYSWCAENGFPATTNKGVHQLRKELAHKNSSKAIYTLRKHKDIDLGKALKKAAEIGKLEQLKNLGGIFNTIASASQEIIGAKKTNLIKEKEFTEFLYFLHQKSNLVCDRYISGLKNIFYYKFYWKKDYKDWKRPSHNKERQFSSLLRHIFAQYEVPLFMDKAWLENSYPRHTTDLRIDWWLHIADGHNIRKAPKLNFPLTKKMAHFFIQAPSTYEINNAFTYGIVMAEEGDRRLAEAIIPSRLQPLILTRCVEKSESYQFILATIRFFINNPMFDRNQVGPVLDYIWAQKYTSREVFINGAHAVLPPAEPNFSFTGRCPDALMRRTEEWHRQLNREKRANGRSWDSMGIEGFEFEEGIQGRPSYKKWVITELLSSRELSAEGKAMRNCVSSYSFSCSRHSSAIFSMSYESLNAGKQKCITIEVSKQGVIQQVRGIYNRSMTPQERQILNRWASKRNLTISSYL